MSRLRHHLNACTAAAGLAAIAVTPLGAKAGSPVPWQIVFDFPQAADGSYPSGGNPYGNLIADSQGRIYGTTSSGGQFNYGVVFRLTRPASGNGGMWTEEVLHSFTALEAGSTLGPPGQLLLGPSGELYGSTYAGGANKLGIIYRLDNVPGWPITILHSFGSLNGTSDPSDGYYPVGGLQFGPGGLLYGVSSDHVDGGYATTLVFSLSPQGDATEYAKLYDFGEFTTPSGGLTPAGPDRFVGTTSTGGYYSYGTVYSLELSATNRWVEKTLYAFGANVNDSLASPSGNPLVVGPGGVLYGCATIGRRTGGVFSLAPPSVPGGPWTETDIYVPKGERFSKPGCSSVTREPTGQILAASVAAIAQISPPASGSAAWTLTERFAPSPGNYLGPVGQYFYGNFLRLDGAYFGTSYAFGEGGPPPYGGDGTIFAFRP